MKRIIGIIIVIILVLSITQAHQKGQDKSINSATNQEVQEVTQETTQEATGSIEVGARPTKEEQIYKNLSYGPHRRNTMNVLIPKGSDDDTPFVLMIHGGAWYMGDKNDFAIAQAAFAQEGIASASINYRYVSASVDYEDLMNDVGLAMDYIVSNGDDWGIDTSKIAIGGISAGAHLSLLYTYRYDTERRITAIIDLAGPVDLTDRDLLEAVSKTPLIKGLNHMVGVPYTQGEELDERFNLVSPLRYVKNIPVLLVHGTADSLVPFNQATKLQDALEEKNIPHKLIPITNADHDLGIGRPNTIKMILEEMIDWILIHER